VKVKVTLNSRPSDGWLRNEAVVRYDDAETVPPINVIEVPPEPTPAPEPTPTPEPAPTPATPTATPGGRSGSLIAPYNAGDTLQ